MFYYEHFEIVITRQKYLKLVFIIEFFDQIIKCNTFNKLFSNKNQTNLGEVIYTKLTVLIYF